MKQKQSEMKSITDEIIEFVVQMHGEQREDEIATYYCFAYKKALFVAWPNDRTLIITLGRLRAPEWKHELDIADPNLETKLADAIRAGAQEFANRSELISVSTRGGR